MNKYSNASRKYARIMKFGGIPIVVAFMLLNVSNASESKAQSILKSEISIRTEQSTLEDILLDIHKSHDVDFTYSIQKVDVSQRVSISKRTTTLSSLLRELLYPLGIDYRVFNNQNIVLSSARTKPTLVSGISLSGEAYRSNGEPVQFANALLQNITDTTKNVQGAITDELGKFLIDEITPGKYQLRLSFIGLQSFDTILDIASSLDIGKVILLEDLNILSGVSVSGRRKLIKQEIDRLVLDVENSMLSSRGTALDVLASTPGVSVRNDQINMIGKSSVGVMVNDKLINLPSEDIANYLRAIASEDIMHIEVISNPPAKYEAQGNSGLINIVLKKARRNSWNASIRSGYTQRTDGAAQVGANFTYNKNKLSVVSSLFFIDGKYNQEQDDYAFFPDGLWYTSSPLLSDYTRINGRLDISYQLTPNWSIGGQAMRNSTDYLITDNPYTPVFDYETDEIIRSLFSSFSQMTWKPRFNSSNLNSSIQLDTLGRTVQFNLDFFDYKNEDIREYIGESVINRPFSKQYYGGYNANNQAVNNLSGAIDVNVPTEWAHLEMGGRVTRSVSTNDIELFNSGLVDEPVNAFLLASNDFKYVENVQAAYFSLSKPLSTKWSIKLGARMEATQTVSSSDKRSLKENNDYIKVFPTVFLNFNPSEKSSYGFNYGRRISRPTFGELNPNVFFINPFQTIVGNAFLQPAFTDNVEFSMIQGKLTSKAYYSRGRDLYSQIPLPNTENNVITFANENYVSTDRYGLSEFFVLDRWSWWSSSNSFDLNYSISRFDLPEVTDDLTGLSSSISTSNDFSVKRVEGLSLNVSFSYFFAGRNNIFNTGEASNLSASVQYLLMDNRLKMSLFANDVFKDSAERLETTVNGVLQTARYYYDNRSIGLSVSYSFGNNNISGRRHRTGNSDERNRTGN